MRGWNSPSRRAFHRVPRVASKSVVLAVLAQCQHGAPSSRCCCSLRSPGSSSQRCAESPLPTQRASPERPLCSAERHSAESHCCTCRAPSCFERRLCNAQSPTCLTCRRESLTCRRGPRAARPRRTSTPSSRPSTRSTRRPCRAGQMRARTQETLRWRRRHSRPLRARCVPRSLRCAYDVRTGPFRPALSSRLSSPGQLARADPRSSLGRSVVPHIG